MKDAAKFKQTFVCICQNNLAKFNLEIVNCYKRTIRLLTHLLPQKTDKEIAVLVSESNRDAFALLYDRYWHAVYLTAMRYLKCPDRAQDLVQDVFMKLWVKRADLCYINQLDNYIFIIARNEVVSCLRKQHRLTPLEPRQDTILADLCDPHTESVVVLKETELLVNRAVEQLPPQQKVAFTLTRHEGLSHAAIAALLGINVRTVNNHITRALANIRRYLDEQNEIGLLPLLFFLVHCA